MEFTGMRPSRLFLIAASLAFGMMGASERWLTEWVLIIPIAICAGWLANWSP